jgi:hypothetical protein
MNTNPQTQSHLFTMRLWMEDVGNGQVEWRGKLRYVVTEEVRYFRDWPGLVALMQAMTQQGIPPTLASPNGNGSHH